ncbi:MAG: glycosyltransferase, partial [Rhodothermales bacterium]|nr:glycosyltransferase [Rhodothermales bacterium]
MILFTIFCVCLGIQVLYLLVLAVGFERARRVAREKSGSPEVPISVVVAARNEAANLPPLLAALGEQTHDRFEVIVADDASTDLTADLVRERSKTDPRFRLVSVKPAEPRKKHALRTAIEQV